MAVKGLDQAIKNLNSLNRIMVPQASAWAINRVAASAVVAVTRKVARETKVGDNRVEGIPVKLVKQRVRISKASATGRSTAKIKVNRGNLPAIKLGAPQVRATRRREVLKRKHSVLRVGRYVFRDAFLQRLANGRWHVMKRVVGKSRYPIDVVKIPLAKPLTVAFEQEKARMLEEEMPKQLRYALKQQLRLYLTR